jgi:hypothetical protein
MSVVQPWVILLRVILKNVILLSVDLMNVSAQEDHFSWFLVYCILPLVATAEFEPTVLWFLNSDLQLLANEIIKIFNEVMPIGYNE